ncbi:hypothetical protein [Candidatus Phytoplasma pruni]|uniref:hypothetical protein n=1 Tax=Candidatus Phytoplasma pruni TaxID=479893 RepID=UPI001FD40DA9|nr:hypothetical protein [Candidatus Phytoplasma pruni]
MVYKKSLQHNSIIKYTRRLFLILFFLVLKTGRTHLLHANNNNGGKDDLETVIPNKELGFIQCADPKKPTRDEILKAVHTKNPDKQIDDIHIEVNFDRDWPYEKASLFPSDKDSPNNPYKGQADLNYETGFTPVDLSQVITSGAIGNVVCSDPKAPTKEEISNRIKQKYNNFVQEDVEVILDNDKPTTQAVAKAKLENVSYNPGSAVDLNYKAVDKLPELSTIITSGEIGNVVCSDPKSPTKEEVFNQLTPKYNTLIKEDVEVVLDTNNPTTQAVVKAKTDSNNYNPGSSVNLTYKTVTQSTPTPNEEQTPFYKNFWYWFLVVVTIILLSHGGIYCIKKHKTKK